MIQTLMLYAVTLALFLGLDMLGIRWIVRPVFDRYIGDLLASPPRLLAAGIFYMAYVAGLLWFVSWPALKAGAPAQALWAGMVLGFLCYGTYEMTNFATLRDWSWQMVATDLVWGTLLTGVSAWVGVALVSRWS